MPQAKRQLPPAADPQETLAWEEKNRWWAIVGGDRRRRASARRPVPLAQAQANEVPELTSALIYFNKHATGFILSQVVISIGTSAAGFRCSTCTTRPRRGVRSCSRGTGAGHRRSDPALVGGIAGQIYLATKAADFVKASKTDPEAN